MFLKGIYLVQVSYLGYLTVNQRVDFTKTTVFGC
jgi:iron complex outermembrane receptor protein